MGKRYELIDTLRGLTIVSMILYHACWDLLYLGFTNNKDLVFGPGAHIWQQSICRSFILISGFCFSLGKRHVRHALCSLAWALLITAVTLIVMPQSPDIFGVLYLLGLSELIAIPIDRVFCLMEPRVQRLFSACALILCLVLFELTFTLTAGYLSFFGHFQYELPPFLYRGLPMTLLGFKDPGFLSTDYFPLLPWSFWYLAGYFLGKIIPGGEKTPGIFYKGISIFSVMGRHSLSIYLLHQPIIYGLLMLIRSLNN